MATIADVNTALGNLATAFSALETQAKVVFASLQANAGNIASAADLDGVVATINTDIAAVQAASAAITVAAPPAA